MTVALHTIGEPAIAQVEAPGASGKKTPPKRRNAPLADQRLVPEPR